MASLSVNTLKSYIGGGFNVIISGIHGVGKTAKLQAACSELGVSMKYYSASTLDPFTDLIGIPVPDKETNSLTYLRRKEIDEADVIFFDELNRADPRTLNAIFEIIQSRSLNGDPLPKLKAVVAAINPVSDEYNTDELDAALLDRFDMFLQADPELDFNYFNKKYGTDIAKAVADFWRHYHEAYKANQNSSNSRNKIAYLSPRRMDKITAAYTALPTRQTIQDCLPPEFVDRSVANQIHQALSNAKKKAAPASGATKDLSAQVTDIVIRSIAAQRSRSTGLLVTHLINEKNLAGDDLNRLLNSLAAALQTSKGANTIAEEFGAAVGRMSNVQLKMLTSGWNPSKRKQLKKEMNDRYSVVLNLA